jgi:hypothetical protein
MRAQVGYVRAYAYPHARILLPRWDMCAHAPI